MKRWLMHAKARVLYTVARTYFILIQSEDRKYILIGEKNGYQARDNAYHLFRYLYESGRRDVFFISRKQNADSSRLIKFGDRIILYNSFRHYRMLLQSKILVINDGFTDVYPKLPGILYLTHEPFYYVEHGIVRYKKLYFNSSHYVGRIVRFAASTWTEVEIVRNRMMPRRIEKELSRIQAYLYLAGSKIDPFDLRNFESIIAKFRALADDEYAPDAAIAWLDGTINQLNRLASRIGFPTARIAPFGLPRHDSLLEKMKVRPPSRKMIVIFLTWRDYWIQSGSDEDLALQPFYLVVREIVDDPRILEFIEAHNLTIGIYTHQKMSAYRSVLSTDLHPRVTVIDDAVDIQDIIVDSAALITDYSSVSFDFCIAGKPIFFYQFDQEHYNTSRGDYTDQKNKWIGDIITDREELIGAITSIFTPKILGNAKNISNILYSDYPELGNSSKMVASAIDSIPPRVTFICYNIFGIGGTVRSVINFSNYLFENGYHVEILSLKRTRQTTSLGLHPSIRVTSLFDATNRSKSIRQTMARLTMHFPSILFDRNEDLYRNVSIFTDVSLISFLKNCSADVIIPTIPSLARAAIKYSRRSTKVLVQEHKYFMAHKPSIRRMIEKTYPHADGILTPTRDDAVQYGSITGVPTFAVPNGVPVRPRVEPVGSPRIRRIVSLGRLDEQKQFDLLIDAFAKVADDFPEWRLFIYGAGPEYEKLKNKISDLQLIRKVFLKGPTSDSGNVIDQADICAVTSSYEGFGMVYIEAYASGKPIVSFDIEKGPKEIMVDGETGLKAKSFDVDDYATKLSTLMASEQLRKTMGENGRRFLTQTYDINKVGLKLEQAILVTAGDKGESVVACTGATASGSHAKT